MAKVFTEKDARNAAKQGQVRLELEKGTVVTPGAVDAARELGLVFAGPGLRYGRLSQPPAKTSEGKKTIALGSDHAGFALKEYLKAFLASEGYSVLDKGVYSEESADYPDVAVQVAEEVSRRRAWRGIVVDAAGIGSAIVANKLPGVRAASCHNVEVARSSREHNDANVLALGARSMSETAAAEIVRAWLAAEIAGGRHQRRLDKIAKIERRFLRT